MKNKLLCLQIIATALVAGCASVTPTTEQQAGYVIYDIKSDTGISASRLADAIKVGLQKESSQVQITGGIPPHPLPEKPGRFRMTNPFAGGSNLALLLGGSGKSPVQVQVPTCDDAILTARAGRTGMARYGESTSFFLCLLPYRDGYHLDIYSEFSKRSGGIDPAALGAALARSVVGDSSQFTSNTIASVVDSIKATGATVTLVEAYP